MPVKIVANQPETTVSETIAVSVQPPAVNPQHQPEPAVEAEAKAAEPATAQVKARAVLAAALQQFIAVGVPESDAHRLQVENAFELVRADIAANRPKRETLAKAVDLALGAVTLLANNSRTRQDALAAFKGEVNQLRKLVG